MFKRHKVHRQKLIRTHHHENSKDDVVGFEANYPPVGPGPIGGMPSVKVFLRDPSPYLHEFLRKPRKTLNG